jgi:hypothetical protein
MLAMRDERNVKSVPRAADLRASVPLALVDSDSDLPVQVLLPLESLVAANIRTKGIGGPNRPSPRAYFENFVMRSSCNNSWKEPGIA